MFLNVGITVILAAVIGSFVLGIGGNQNAAPQAAFTCEGVDLAHNGGESLENGTLVYSGSSSNFTGNLPYQAGDKLVSSCNGTLTWENPDGDDSQILYDGDCTS